MMIVGISDIHLASTVNLYHLPSSLQDFLIRFAIQIFLGVVGGFIFIFGFFITYMGIKIKRRETT
jgi:hypothetical protein